MLIARSWWFLVGSVALIAAATLLPFEASDVGRMQSPWCFSCGGMWLSDAVSNVLLFVPFGISLAARDRTLAVVSGWAALLSFAVELSQSIGVPPGRSPAIADLIANSGGAACGWLLFQNRRAVVATDGRGAALAICWWLVALLAVIFTALAETIDESNAPTSLQVSQIEYAPGFGWYDGLPVDAQVSSSDGLIRWIVPHSGTGPIVAEANRASNEWHVIVRSLGRDSATYRRAMFFLHLSGDSTAEVLLTQHDRSVELQVRRRALAWGLAFPSISTGAVLLDLPTNDSIVVQAHITRRSMRLHAAQGTHGGFVQFALTPAIGWTMLQSLVGVQHPVAPLIQLLWLGALFLPAAWWSGRSQQPLTLAVTSFGTFLLLFGVAPWMDVSPFPTFDLITVVGFWSLGALLGWRHSLRYPNALPG